MANIFQHFKSSTLGAPVLNGQSGSLIRVLDYCLTGSTTGWTRTFTSSSNGSVARAVYRQASGSQFYLNVQDDSLSTPKEARFWGWESATSQDTGSGQFPNSVLAQGVPSGYGYLVMRKSATADATARAWQCFVDTSTIYLFALSTDGSAYQSLVFGDIYSLKPNDAYKCMAIGRVSENGATGENLQTVNALNTNVAGHYIARTYGGGGYPVLCGKHGDTVKGGGNTTLVGTVQYPNGADGTLYMSPLWIHEPTTLTVRGRMRGFWHLCHATANFADGDTINGSSTLSGKTFQIVKPTEFSGHFCIETSATLETGS